MSAAGLISLLEEKDVALRTHALKSLNQVRPSPSHLCRFFDATVLQIWLAPIETPRFPPVSPRTGLVVELRLAHLPAIILALISGFSRPGGGLSA